MTTLIGAGAYVMGDSVRRDDPGGGGVDVWWFSSHFAAVAALLRLNDPTFEPLTGWGPGDLETFEQMREAVQ